MNKNKYIVYLTPEEHEKTFNQSKYINEWKKANNKQYAFRFNKVTDKEIIELLDSQEDKTDFIRNLILKELKRIKNHK